MVQIPPVTLIEPSPATPATLALIAFADEAMLRGAISLQHARLADLLEEGGPLDLAHAASERHADGAISRLGTATLPQEALSAVIATGPLGNPGRRIDTRAHAARIRLVGYEVLGRLHVPPGLHPEEWVNGRRWIAVTDAVLRYTSRGTRRAQLHATVLVHRERITELVPVEATAYGRELDRVAGQGSGGPVVETMAPATIRRLRAIGGL